MKSKDQILLESIYQKIFLKENDKDGEEEADYDQYKHSGVPSGNPSEDYGDFSEEEDYGDFPENSDISENVPDGGVLIKNDTPSSFFQELVPRNIIIDYGHEGVAKIYFDGNRFTEALVSRKDGRPTSTKISLNSLNDYFKQWPNQNIGRLVSASMFSTEKEESEDRYLDSGYEDRYSESFIHGIQPIVEAKKKELPLALKKAIEKKTGKKFGKKNKDEPTKGFIKLAKKSGKKITSDKIKPKKK